MIPEAAVDPVCLGALRIGAALLFLTAALHKARDPGGFRGALAGYEILPAASVPTVAAAIAIAEFAIGIACAIPATGAAGCAAAAALVWSYSLAVGWNLVRGRRAIDCGCGGPGGHRPLSPGLLARNAGVVALLLVAALPGSGRALVWLDAASIAGAAGVLALAYAGADAALANAARLSQRREAA